MNVGIHMMDMDLMAMLNKSTPEHDVEVLRLEKFTMCLISRSQFKSNCDSTHIPNFYLSGGVEDLLLVLDYLIAFISFQYNVNMAGDSSFLDGSLAVPCDHNLMDFSINCFSLVLFMYRNVHLGEGHAMPNYYVAGVTILVLASHNSILKHFLFLRNEF